MIFLFLLSLVLLPTAEGHYVNSPLAHLSDSLKLKCDALPYRTVYANNRCYFAVSKEVKYSEATVQCSSIFPGSHVSTDTPGTVFDAIMVDSSKFHAGKDASTVKQSICVYENGYKCDKGEQSPVIAGKCLVLDDKKKNFGNALIYCKSEDMEVPAVGNDLETRMIRGIVGAYPVWIRHIYKRLGGNRWHRDKQFGRYTTCVRPNPRIWNGVETGRLCSIGTSAIVDKTGYWGSDWDETKTGWANVCIKDAANAYTPAGCAANHVFDEKTGLCEWTGPKDACLEVIDYAGLSMFVNLTNFPKETQKETSFIGTKWNDKITKVVVRRGCMFTGWTADVNQNGKNNELMPAGNINRGYGEVKVHSWYTGEFSEAGPGMSRLNCFCDPTEFTLNDHVPAPPPRQECIEHHVFDETTRQCEWKHDPKYCAELITSDGRRQKLEISNWPTNKKYDVDHWRNVTKQKEDFHFKITEVIVRQHCWATMYWRNINERMTLKPSGYGKHQVESFYNGKLRTYDLGTTRVVCDCLR